LNGFFGLSSGRISLTKAPKNNFFPAVFLQLPIFRMPRSGLREDVDPVGAASSPRFFCGYQARSIAAGTPLPQRNNRECDLQRGDIAQLGMTA
jgi:hypothetical protein